MKDVVVVVLHYNKDKMTNACVDSILKTSNAHVLVVDNNSDIPYKRDDVIVIRNNDRRCVSGMNFGYYHALYNLNAKYIVNMDNDVICHKDWLEPLIKEMEEHPKTGICGGKQWSDDGTYWRSVGKDLTGVVYKNWPEERFEAVWITGSFVMMRGEMMKRIGLHDDRFAYVCSDSDYCIHALDRDWQVIFVPESNVTHICNASIKEENIDHGNDIDLFLQKWTGKKFSALADKFPVCVTDETFAKIDVSMYSRQGVSHYQENQHARCSTIEFVKHFGDKKIYGAEVGVSFGNNAKSLLSELRNIVTLYLIDNNKDGWNHDVRERFNDDNRVIFIEKESAIAANNIPDGFLDFVYIDAEHAYKNVFEDIKAWLPKVRKGGMIAGHDYFNSIVEDDFNVVGAVNDSFSEEDIHTDNIDWWVYV